MKKKDESDSTKPSNTESEGKNTSYWKVILIFTLAMAALLFGLSYLFNHIF